MEVNESGGEEVYNETRGGWWGLEGWGGGGGVAF